jgi:hypothetical protein
VVEPGAAEPNSTDHRVPGTKGARKIYARGNASADRLIVAGGGGRFGEYGTGGGGLGGGSTCGAGQWGNNRCTAAPVKVARRAQAGAGAVGEAVWVSPEHPNICGAAGKVQRVTGS